MLPPAPGSENPHPCASSPLRQLSDLERVMALDLIALLENGHNFRTQHLERL